MAKRSIMGARLSYDWVTRHEIQNKVHHTKGIRRYLFVENGDEVRAKDAAYFWNPDASIFEI